MGAEGPRALALLLLCALAAGCAGEPGSLARPAPAVLADGEGGVFAVERLVALTPDGAVAAILPRNAAATARDEDRIDLGRAPLLDQVFAPRQSTGDAARLGLPVGEAYRAGATLILDLVPGTDPAALPLVLTTAGQRIGPVSYRLGRLGFAETAEPEGARQRVGTVYRQRGALVVATGRVTRDILDLLGGGGL